MLSACNLAPDYQPPQTTLPAAYKETGPWTSATPRDALPRGAWWKIYNDTVLDGLESRLETDNPSLAEAVARYEGAQGYLEEAQSGLLPTLAGVGHANTDRQSDNRPLRSASQPTYYGDDLVAVGLDWDLDLWGKLRNEVAAGRFNVQSAFAITQTIRLSLQAQLANDFFALRGLDAQGKLLEDSLRIYDRALALTRDRHDKGIASGLDVGRAETQDDNARAELADIRSRRALLEHAIASLVGKPASDFAIAPAVVDYNVPNIPTVMPSRLLQRRPDVAAAERQVAATNAEIGVARAAFYPDISLSALGGFQNTGNDSLFTAPDALWALGPSAVLTIFDAGRNEGRLAIAKAANSAAAAAYRRTVLQAFQDVEDGLSQLNRLAEAADAQAASVKAATHTQDLALALYRNGALGFLDVVVAQTTALEAQQASISLQTRRLEASVDLIRALGGGWTASDIPEMANADEKSAHVHM